VITEAPVNLDSVHERFTMSHALSGLRALRLRAETIDTTNVGTQFDVGVLWARIL